MHKQSLHNHWTARAVNDVSRVPAHVRHSNIRAKVPGCIHTDLLRAGMIEDPYFGLNETSLRWIGETDWEYRCTFSTDTQLFNHERIDLVCDGLDTIATIILNDHEIARTKNMHRTYRFDARKTLRHGENELIIRFDSPVKYARAMHDKLGHLPSINYGIPFNFIRKMACNFGWDWGPVVPTCGIWKSIRIEAWSHLRIESARIEIESFHSKEATIGATVQFEAGKDPTQLELEPAVCEAIDIGLQPVGERTNSRQLDAQHVYFQFKVPAPKIWWPVGHGEQPLYHLFIQLNKAGTTNQTITNVIDRYERRFGIRVVELDTSPDDIGRQFTLKVNGKPIFCKGFNWIPDDCFLDRACDPIRVRKRIEQARDANANMLRVWGGGIYETDDFYNICDELGMLVWQDFPFACAAYPEDDETQKEVEAEARDNISRLAHHASLVLWNGCNENLWGYHVWGDQDQKDSNGNAPLWKDSIGNRGWGTKYYFDILPRVLRELDPSRPYWPASPWSGDEDVVNGLHPNLSTHGNKHIWEVWHGAGDYNNYRWFSPRFCSEFGYQGPPNFSTLRENFDTNELHRDSPTMQLHQKSPGGNERNDRLLLKDFDLPDDFNDWHYLLQLNQARALQTGVEWFRSRQPTCMGTLYWQLNDCYPAISWSAIDSAGRCKPLWFATRRFFAPRLLTIQPEVDALVLYANNDSDGFWNGELLVSRMRMTGEIIANTTFPLAVSRRTNHRAQVLPMSLSIPNDSSSEFVVATFGDSRAFHFFASDRDLKYPQPDFEIVVRETASGCHVDLIAKTLLREVMFNIDRLDPAATISDNLLTLLPGESRSIEINSREKIIAEQIAQRPIFQCANFYGKRS